MKRPAKELLKNNDVKRWHENLARGSKLNADIRLRRLNLFCHTINTTPTRLVSVGNKNILDIENILLDHVSWLESQNYSPNYIDGIIKSIKSWLSYNYIEPRRKIRIANAGIAVSIQDEQIPTKDELKSILNVASTRARASISLMAFSGLRPQVMGNAEGTDGLKLSDLEITLEGKKVQFTQMPAMITIRATLSKTRNKYHTFLPEEGCQYVLGYLRKRIADGEILNQDSSVISFKKGYKTKGKRKLGKTKTAFITTPRITAEIREAIWCITKVRPYVLRAYFDTQLLLAESNGKMTHAYRQFFMGHKGDIEARYTTNKGRLTDEMKNDMCRTFFQSEEFLCTRKNDSNTPNKKEMLLEMWREQAKMYGIDPIKIRIEKQRVNDTFDGKEEVNILKDAILAASSNLYQGKIVTDDEQLLNWEPVKELKNNKILIRKKNQDL